MIVKLSILRTRLINSDSYILFLLSKCVCQLKEFIFQNYYTRIEFSKESIYCSMNETLLKKDLLLLSNKLI